MYLLRTVLGIYVYSNILAIFFSNGYENGKYFFIHESKSCSVMSNSATPWTIQSMEFPRPEYWSGQHFPSPGEIPNLGIEPRSPTLQADSSPVEPQGQPYQSIGKYKSKLQDTAFIPIRMATIQRTDNNNWWQGCEEIGTLTYCQWECKIVQPLWKNSLAVVQTVTQSHHMTSHSTLKRIQNIYPHKHLCTNSHSSVIHQSKN